ncbi:MAG: glycosyltransferase family 4 protein [Candidatus Dojkabacteria bacterium]
MYNSINNYLTNAPQDFNDILIVDGSQETGKSGYSTAYYETIGFAEYLTAMRIFTKVIKQKDLKLHHLKLFRGFIFYNIANTNTIQKFIDKADYHNKTVFLLSSANNSYPKYESAFIDRCQQLTLTKNDIFIPDEVIKHIHSSPQQPKEIDYLLFYSNSTDGEYIKTVIEQNLEKIKALNLKVVIITGITSKISIPLPIQLHNYFSIRFYRNHKEKLSYIVSSKQVFLNYANSKEFEINCIECDLCKTSRLTSVLTKKNYKINDYNKLLEKYTSVYSKSLIFRDIQEKLAKSIVFNVAGTVVRGGINVIVKHAHVLRNCGFDVTFLSDDSVEENIITSEGEINVVSRVKCTVRLNIDILVATLWITCFYVERYPDAKRKMYLVQGFETDFSPVGDAWRILANITYRGGFEYLTISKWCSSWLAEHYHQKPRYCPNGLNTQLFSFVKKDFNGKIRILIEGSNKEEYRNIDESFRITNSLDPDKYEVWYMTYDGAPKNWYRCDKFFLKVPYEKVVSIYQSCHILLKSSKLESFSYPPLEMMATGGVAIVAQNHGNMEYVKHRFNCMVYQVGDEKSALEYIYTVVEDGDLREQLIANGYKLAQSRSWESITQAIIELYS